MDNMQNNIRSSITLTYLRNVIVKFAILTGLRSRKEII